jgi:hypothetical protein
VQSQHSCVATAFLYIFYYISTRTYINTAGMNRLTQGIIHQYENVKRKLLFCNADIYFNQQCLHNKVTPKFARIKIPGNSPAEKSTRSKIKAVLRLHFYIHFIIFLHVLMVVISIYTRTPFVYSPSWINIYILGFAAYFSSTLCMQSLQASKRSTAVSLI